jgi:uncharacterized membrane protein YidH (DUF202 family)
VPKHFLQKVEPKIFFACERTFIAWMHAATLMAGTSMAIVAFSDKRSIQRQLYGTLMLPLAIIFLSYALWQCKYLLYSIRNACNMLVLVRAECNISIVGDFVFSLVSCNTRCYAYQNDT